MCQPFIECYHTPDFNNIVLLYSWFKLMTIYIIFTLRQILYQLSYEGISAWWVKCNTKVYSVDHTERVDHTG